jgi:CBS domain-containing protein
MAAYTQGEPLRGIPVSRAMAKQVFSCRPDESLDAAQRLMTVNRIRRLPVVDDEGRPLGVLSLNDIARDAVASRGGDGAQREVARTLAAICQPRPGNVRATHTAVPTGPEAAPAGR